MNLPFLLFPFYKICNFDHLTLRGILAMLEKMRQGNRASYQKEYRENYGDFIQEQIKEWFIQHPEYLKEWRKSHPDYYRKYRNKYHHKLNIYWREYRRRSRTQKSS